MEIEDIRNFCCHTEDDHKELDKLLENYILKKQLEDVLYKELYGTFPKLTLKEKK